MQKATRILSNEILFLGILMLKFEAKDAVGNLATSNVYDVWIDGVAPAFSSFGPTVWVQTGSSCSVFIVDGLTTVDVSSVKYWRYSSLGWDSGPILVDSYVGLSATVGGLAEGMLLDAASRGHF